MNEHNNIEETLWSYIDGSMSAEEIFSVEQMLHTNDEWKVKHAELKHVHHLMQSDIELDQPSLRFTQNVMEEVSQLKIAPVAKQYLNKNIIRSIGIFFLTAIAGLIIYSFGQLEWTPSSAENSSYTFTNNVNWRQFFSNSYINVFMMANTILALMLFDMYLTYRKKLNP